MSFKSKNNNLRTGYSSPKRRPFSNLPLSPFSTSPNQLQEFTLDYDTTFSSFASPGGAIRGGRSVKEIEEQLSNLKKENFDLKLRIYFLEEKMCSNLTLDKDNVVKKNIDLQVEITSLRKQLEEKHEVLLQAAKAMELQDDEHKKVILSKDEQFKQCQQEIEDLRQQLQCVNFDGDCLSHKSDVTGYYSRASNIQDGDNLVSDLHEKIRLLELELNSQKENNVSLKLIVDQTECTRLKCESLQKELQLKDEQIASLSGELSAANETIKSYSQQNAEMQSKVDKFNIDNQILVKRYQDQNKKYEQLSEEFNDFKKKFVTVKIELEREQKRNERSKVYNEVRIGELEEENDKHKLRIRELQSKLEAALVEVKKNQNLAVSKSSPSSPSASNTHNDSSISVPNSPTPDGAAEAQSLPLPVAPLSPSSFKFPSQSPPTSPHKSINLKPLENALKNSKDMKILLADIKDRLNKYDKMEQKIVKLKAENLKACTIIKSMIASRDKANAEMKELQKQKEELEKELEMAVTRPDMMKSSSSKPLVQKVVESGFATPPNLNEKSMGENLNDEELVEQYRVLIEELEKKNEILTATLKQKDCRMQQIQADFDNLIHTLNDKEARLVDLQFELMSVQKDNSFMNTSEDKDEQQSATNENLSCQQQQIKEKDEEIQRLNNELKKANLHLQEIINKELWQKNREIEKMHNKQNSLDVSKLQKELELKDMQLSLLKERISELGIENASDDKALERLSGKIDSNENQFIEKLETENKSLLEEMEKIKKLQFETNEVCQLLSCRLEELAVFLDSLLKQKAILGFLGAQKNRKLQEIINNSLEFSRSFSMNISVNPDVSLTQLSNITALLNDSAHLDDVQADFSLSPSRATLTYQSHYHQAGECDQEKLINTLRQQILNLKYELQLRDNELGKLNEFSEQKTDEEKLKLNTSSTLKLINENNHSESESWSEPDRSVSRARMGIVDNPPEVQIHKLKDSTEEESLDYLNVVSSPSKRRQSSLQRQISELQQEIERKNAEIVQYEELQQRLADFEQQLEESEQQLSKCENLKAIAEKEVQNLNALVDELISNKKDLEDTVKSDKDLINNLEKEKEEAENLAQILKEEKATVENDLKNILIKLSETEAILQSKQSEFNDKIKETNEKWQKEINNIQTRFEDLKNEYAQNFVKKVDVEERIKQILLELANERKLVESQKVKENDLTSKVQLKEEKLINLQKELDNLTLQYSETVLEKSKVANEKALLEQELSKINVAETQLRQQFRDIQHEMNELKNNRNSHLRQLEKEKSKLELKISELESNNAELHNKLIKFQYKMDLNNSCPSNVTLRRQASNDNYSSEEGDELRMYSVNRNVTVNAEGQVQRNEATSSPDLGIESDQGRFSSLETQNKLPRPFLETIELTQSMSNLLDLENNVVDPNCCGNDECFERIRNIALENNKLKIKLMELKGKLNETENELNLANRRKKKVEKTIFKEMCKTSKVLKIAKANLDAKAANEKQ